MGVPAYQEEGGGVHKLGKHTGDVVHGLEALECLGRRCQWVEGQATGKE